jgi:hypothetical protein
MESNSTSIRVFAPHGWLGLGLIAVFWTLNWSLEGLRTHALFFPLWLGFCLFVDALVALRRGTSLLLRSRLRYIGLFAISAPVWWIFEVLNRRLQNWDYQGAEFFTPFQFWLWATLSFTTVVPAVFGSAELMSTFSFVKRLGKGLRIHPDRRTTVAFLLFGLASFAAMWAWPRVFFPFMWISLYCVFEPVNIWLGNRSLGSWTGRGDWRPVVSLWLGVLLTGFFWEMWNYLSFPKWIYHVPWGSCCHLFEMPLLGYGGYLPFALELFALYHLVTGLLGDRQGRYVQFDFEE